MFLAEKFLHGWVGCRAEHGEPTDGYPPALHGWRIFKSSLPLTADSVRETSLAFSSREEPLARLAHAVVELTSN